MDTIKALSDARKAHVNVLIMSSDARHAAKLCRDNRIIGLIEGLVDAAIGANPDSLTIDGEVAWSQLVGVAEQTWQDLHTIASELSGHDPDIMSGRLKKMLEAVSGIRKLALKVIPFASDLPVLSIPDVNEQATNQPSDAVKSQPTMNNEIVYDSKARSATWNGTTARFSPDQNKAFGILHAAYMSGNPSYLGRSILEALGQPDIDPTTNVGTRPASYQERIQDVFRGCPLWKTLICASKKKGWWELKPDNLPKQK